MENQIESTSNSEKSVEKHGVSSEPLEKPHMISSKSSQEFPGFIEEQWCAGNVLFENKDIICKVVFENCKRHPPIITNPDWVDTCLAQKRKEIQEKYDASH